MADNPGNVVCMTVPADERMIQVLRLATTAVASRTGLNIDQADDISTALDELLRLVISRQASPDFKFCVRYIIREDGLEVITSGVDVDLFDDSSNVIRYCRFILEKVTDDFTEEANPDGGFDVHIIKRMDHGKA